ncbi:hypothetical protein [Sphingomonas morindae]|uniref:ATPase n=1 Tax=Sphingomonas morindae TaxID=1541170 RepID=A0ABY4X4D7_9SPHN|nr:hypothetical protein [Sphingomonas morindae]USI71768.1 hypothetical protein LHA26_10585 [Sphingomonas morindae]
MIRESVPPELLPPPVDAPPPPPNWRARALLGLFAFAALAWLALAIGLGLSAASAGGIDAAGLARGISLASGPLALLVALLILWQRNASREAGRYADVARGVRMETLALDAVLSLASRRLAEDRAAVAEQADRLLSLADQTSAKLTDATALLAREIAELGRQSRDLDAAAGTARVDMGVLLADLPVAEGQVRGLAETLRAAGVGAHEQAAALQAVLAALAGRAKEAEENAAGAANRLSAQVSRIAGASEVATRDIDEAGTRMTGAIDSVMHRAAEAVGRAQSAAEAAAERAAATLEARVAAIRQEVAALAETLAAQDHVGAELVERIQRGLSAVEARFAELDETGGARTQRLGEALGLLWTHAERTMATLNDGGTAATTLINRTETLKGAIAACLGELGEALPEAIGRLERQAARSQALASAALPEVERLESAAATAAAALEAARTELDARRASIEALGEAITARLAGARSDAEALDAAVAGADSRAEKLASSTSPRLVEALIRVRETAGQAAQRAREALGAIVPHSASALGEASRKALEAAMTETVDAQVARIAGVSQEAVAAARAAADKLESDLARIAETSASVEAHIAAGKAEVESSDRDNFSRRVAHLIDSLNSTSIDVAKLLSNETADSAWAAYLKGDRGVFTRRAVRLLDNGDVREITRHYEGDAEFRDQVNRYIHDFEALLRPILATRDGSTLAVILLSSEMGKLYVALAQAIERLRA